MTSEEFAVIYNEHYNSVYLYAFKSLPKFANDIVQESFLRLWKNNNPIKNVCGWLLRIAKNLILDIKKSSYYKLARKHDNDNEDWLFAYHSSKETPLDCVLRKEMIEGRFKLLRALSQSDQEILNLAFYEEKSAPEIAKILNVKATAINMRIDRARKRYIKALNQTPYALNETFA